MFVPLEKMFSPFTSFLHQEFSPNYTETFIKYVGIFWPDAYSL